MHAIASLLTTIYLAGFATAAPASSTAACHAKLFNTPWTLSEIKIYRPNNYSSSQTGSIEFLFCDQNPRLKLDTMCSGTVNSNGACEGSDGGYVICENQNVAFQLQSGGVVMVERTYKDHCLGQYPYNYGTAFGQNTTQLSVANVDLAGRTMVQEEMLVKITAQI